MVPPQGLTLLHSTVIYREMLKKISRITALNRAIFNVEHEVQVCLKKSLGSKSATTLADIFLYNKNI